MRREWKDEGGRGELGFRNEGDVGGKLEVKEGLE